MKKYDLIVIGMGPAGMAVSAMGSAMGLNILSVEQDKVGGECLNVGCIPSKALLKAGDVKHMAENLSNYGIDSNLTTKEMNPLAEVRKKIEGITGKKLMKAFETVDLIIQKGSARFVSRDTIEVNGEQYSGKFIFIATGTEPFIPPIPGLKDVPKLTNVNIFNQNKIPESLNVIGGGAIGTEMAQAFARLGSKVNIIHMDDHLVPLSDMEAGKLLEEMLSTEGIGVFNGESIEKVSEQDGKIVIQTSKNEFISEKILVATGRTPNIENLGLDGIGIKYGKKGILVDDFMKTSVKNIYAVGDCNGYALFSHAAMHQGMLALMHAVSPLPMKMFRKSRYLVPWSVFTQPEIAQIGLTEIEAEEKGLNFEVTKKSYESYGRTIADGHKEGFIKIISSPRGKIYGATIIGESASELIHEWALAIKKNMNMFDIMMMQHSFPTISMINKMVTEEWMMKKMKSRKIQKLIAIFFKL